MSSASIAPIAAGSVTGRTAALRSVPRSRPGAARTVGEVPSRGSWQAVVSARLTMTAALVLVLGAAA